MLEFSCSFRNKCISWADLEGGEGAAPPPPRFRQVITQKKAKLCFSQTVKSNILLSQNAGYAISETLDVQNFPRGPDPPSRARASPLADRYTVNRPPPPFQNPGSAPVSVPAVRSTSIEQSDQRRADPNTKGVNPGRTVPLPLLADIRRIQKYRPLWQRCEVRIRLPVAACLFRIPGSDSDCQDPIRKTDL